MNGYYNSFRIAILITFRMTCLDLRWIFNIESHEEKLRKSKLIPRKRK